MFGDVVHSNSCKWHSHCLVFFPALRLAAAEILGVLLEQCTGNSLWS